MNLTTKTVNNIGYVSITLMMGLLLLLWFRIVPESFAIPFFIVALVLFIGRFVLRMKLAKLERQAQQSDKLQPSQRNESSSS